MTPNSEQSHLNLSATGRGKVPGKEAKEPLQIRIPVGIKRRFKAYAAMQGMEPNRLFIEVWGFFEQAHGLGTAKKDRNNV